MLSITLSMKMVCVVVHGHLAEDGNLSYAAPLTFPSFIAPRSFIPVCNCLQCVGGVVLLHFGSS